MFTNKQENLYPVLLQNIAEELGSRFQKTMNENNLEDLKKLMSKIIDFIDMSLLICQVYSLTSI